MQDLQQRAEAKVAGLEAHIAMLKDQIASLQVWPLLEYLCLVTDSRLRLSSQCYHSIDTFGSVADVQR